MNAETDVLNRCYLLDFLASGHTLCIFRLNGVCDFISSKHGLAPLLEYVQSKPSSYPIVVFDRVVGHASALLLSKINCVKVYTEVISEPAVDSLEQNGIAYYFLGNVVSRIVDKNGVLCPMEQMSLSMDAETFCEVARSRGK